MKYVDNQTKLKDALEYLTTQNNTVFGVDTETNGLDPHTNEVLLIQIGNFEEQFVFDVFKLGTSIFEVINWLSDNKSLKILHNAKFDYKMIKGRFKKEISNMRCTMIGEKLLTAGLNVRHNLGAVGNKYIGVDLNKDAQKSFVGMKPGDEFTEEQIEYAGLDVKYLPKIYQKMFDLIKERDMVELYDLESETVPVTGDMELNGIYIDKKRWLSLKDDAFKRLNKAIKELDQFFIPIVGEDLMGKANINYGSPAQLLGPLKKITDTDIESTGAEVLEGIDHPAAEALLNYREAAKKISTYGEEFLKQHVNPATGRIHSSFYQHGTKTGRYASRDVNLQNIPSEDVYRAAFRAQKPDYKIIGADFSSQEIRLLAYITQDPTFKKAFNEGKDPHCMAASILFDLPYEDFFYYGQDGIKQAISDNSKLMEEELGLNDNNEVIEVKSGEALKRPDMNSKYRKPAKSINFGLIYGMGAGKLSRELGITFGEAKALMEKYFSKFPSIKEKLNEYEEFVMKNHYAFSPLDKRRLQLNHIDWDHPGHLAHAKNQAKNFPFQGGGASVTKRALVNVKKRIDEIEVWDVRILITVHDEILLECHKDDAEEVAAMLSFEMRKAFNYYAPGIEMPVIPTIDDCWIH